MKHFLQGVFLTLVLITVISVFWPDGMIPQRAFVCMETDSKGCVTWVRKDHVEVQVTKKSN